MSSENSISDQTLRTLLDGSGDGSVPDQTLNLTNSNLNSNMNPNFTVTETPVKQLVTVVPNSETERAKYSSIVRNSIQTAGSNEAMFDNVPDINFSDSALSAILNEGVRSFFCYQLIN